MPPITALYASLLGFLLVGLAFRVILLRRSEKVGYGDADIKPLRKAIRVHANATENIPIALILIYFAEVSTQSPWLIHLLGSFLLLGRLVHAQGLGHSLGYSLGRFYGTLITWLVIIFSGLVNLFMLMA